MADRHKSNDDRAAGVIAQAESEGRLTPEEAGALRDALDDMRVHRRAGLDADQALAAAEIQELAERERQKDPCGATATNLWRATLLVERARPLLPPGDDGDALVETLKLALQSASGGTVTVTY